MHLNEPVVLAEMDTDRMDHDLMRPHSYPGYYPHNNHHQHHHHHHHHHLMAEDPLQAHTARQKRKMKLKDMALRESRDPQDLMESPEPMDNKRRHIESHSKEFKGKHPVKDYAPGDKRLKVNRDSGDPMNARREKKNSMRKVPRERSESHISTTRDSTPTTPVDGTMSDHGTPPPRQRRPIEGNSNNSNNMPGASPSSGNRPRPFVCNIEDCGKRFVDALQLERHIDRHRPKELECDLDMCGKLFSDIMLLRRHQSMVHKRRSEKWESPPGTTRQRSGRSRRREPRIVASGDVIDPAVLERQPRGSQEVDHSADDYGEEDSGRDDDDATPTATLSIKKEKELKPSLVKTPKEPKEFKGPRTFKQPKIKSPKEHQPPQGYIPKKLAPKAGDDGTGAGDMDVDASEVTRLSPQRAQGPSEDAQSKASASAGSRPRPFHCTYDDCKKVFIDAIQLERHLERHGPKELECGIDGCRKRFSAQMLLRRHQSMVHKRRSPAVPISSKTGANYHKAAAAAVASGPLDPSRRSTPAPPALASTLHSHPTQEEERASTSTSASPYGESRQAQTSFLSETENRYELDED
ncbi:hypothetical protein BC939DRAFT_215330 [Gamsiella multidivaricata]|uniref:uncharacterized protein n=1 Tax=Gamsiella multidivaricata TaxID=101098 RepID=UPI00222047C4|nr:uncharacterized protein BC939DRAFT_215330 [Gamsiella multidivaricata]KAI7820983.1 hypothetical protein BC939DRAFT_215330 [Gamsiella multidivaricata]